METRSLSKTSLESDIAIARGERLAIDDALEALAELDPTQARIVELRFFGGLTVHEVATVLGVSKRKVEWRCCTALG